MFLEKMRFLIYVITLIILNGCYQSSELLFPQPSPSQDLAILQEKQQWNLIPLDMLFVIESSEYLPLHKELLTTYINELLRFFYRQKQVIDFHIKIIVASSSNVEELIDGSEVFTNATFNELFQEDTLNLERFSLDQLLDLGAFAESRRFFDAVARVIPEDKTFYREDAHLFVIFIGHRDQSQSFNVASLTDRLLTLKKNNKSKVNVLSLQTPDEEECTPEFRLEQINELVEMFDGSMLSICDPQSITLLTAVQNSVYRNVARIALKKIPILESMNVCYGSQLIPFDGVQGWSYLPYSNMITFAKDLFLEPAENSSDQNKESPPLNNSSVDCDHEGGVNPEVIPLFSLTYTSAIPAPEYRSDKNIPSSLNSNTENPDK